VSLRAQHFSRLWLHRLRLRGSRAGRRFSVQTSCLTAFSLKRSPDYGFEALAAGRRFSARPFFSCVLTFLTHGLRLRGLWAGRRFSVWSPSFHRRLGLHVHVALGDVLLVYRQALCDLGLRSLPWWRVAFFVFFGFVLWWVLFGRFVFPFSSRVLSP